MRQYSLFLTFLLTLNFAYVSGQQLFSVTTLTENIGESSGLLYLQSRLITHNDSGGEAALYEIDTLSGSILRKVIVTNAQNRDWEDMCSDGEKIYIGDFGNNNGTRKDLTIYILSISDYLTTKNDSIVADKIIYSYKEQTDFTSAPLSTNFDAESLISYGDSLYIFTKNWIDFKSNIYALPKAPGTYQISRIDSINSEGLITSGAYNPFSNTVILTGYSVFSPFIVEIKNPEFNRLSKSDILRYEIEPEGSIQVEAITPIDPAHYFLTSEMSATGDPKLSKLKSEVKVVQLNHPTNSEQMIYPNPTSKVLHISGENPVNTTITDLRGNNLISSSNQEIDISDLKSGVYIVMMHYLGDKKTTYLKLVIE